MLDNPISRHPEFRYKTEFQSHEPEVILENYYIWLVNWHLLVLSYTLPALPFSFQFDYLKSLEIEEKINKIRWCQTTNGGLFLLSTNDKTIKYWRVSPFTIKFLKFYYSCCLTSGWCGLDFINHFMFRLEPYNKMCYWRCISTSKMNHLQFFFHLLLLQFFWLQFMHHLPLFFFHKHCIRVYLFLKFLFCRYCG